jgi:hypothetical protein
MLAKMATTCLCGTTFATVEATHKHATTLGHLFECHCGTIVASKAALKNHKRDVGHDLKGKADRCLDLTEPHTDPRKCGLCVNKLPFKDQEARDQHIADKHHSCPVCVQVFALTVDRLRHQKAANHCYCAEHNEAFSRPSDYADHKRADVHISSFECTDCQREFRSDKALDHHLLSDGHAKVVARAELEEAEWQAAVLKKAQYEESNLYCEACNKKFVHLGAFRQHKESLKHKPLSELKCPLSNKCTGKFSSPSALLFHLESGGCKGGMTRNKLNAVVYQHDSDRHITSTPHANRVLNTAMSEVSRASVAPGSSASHHARTMSVDRSGTGRSGSIDLTPNVSDVSSTLGSEVHFTARGCKSSSSDGSEVEFGRLTSASETSSTTDGVLVTPSASTTSSFHSIYTPSASGSSDGSIILTPPASMAGSKALSDWSFLESTRIMTPSATSVDGSSVDTLTFDTVSNRWPCQICEQTFRKKHDLLQHMNSVTHAPKIFHCPTDLPGLPGSGKPTIAFKTLSGLAQHLEAGSCKGGKATLAFIVGVFEKQIQAKLGKSVKLLKE